MKTIMKLEDLTTIDQLKDFLSGTQAVTFSVISGKHACCPRAPSRRKRLTLYRQQLTRLIAQYRKNGQDPAPQAHCIRLQTKVHG